MPMTLEMPADLDQSTAQPDTAAADEVAGMLDQPEGGELEAAEAGDDCPFDTTAEQPTVNDQPAKKKRGRKKKSDTTPVAEQPADAATPEQFQDHPFDTNQPTGDAEAIDGAEDAAAAAPPTPPVTPEPTPEATALADKLAKPMSLGISPPTRRMQIAILEGRYIEACLETQEAEELIERTKDHLKALREIQSDLSIKLRDLRAGGPWQPELPMGDPDKAAPTPTPPTTPATDSPAPPTFNENWRAALIESLNLSPSLAEKLAENNVTTIGQLEDLRAEIALGKAKWPKGIGAAKITQIEDAVVKWLTENRDAAAFAEIGGVGRGGGEVAAESPAAAASSSSNTTTIPTPDQWEALTDDEQQAYRNQRIELIDDGSENSLATKHPDGSKFWDSGYQAYGQGLLVSDCPYIPGDNQDDWLRGWLAHGKVEKYEPDAKASTSPSPTAAAPSPTLADLDDL